MSEQFFSSQASTIPYELDPSQTDNDFIAELINVDNLYFHENDNYEAFSNHSNPLDDINENNSSSDDENDQLDDSEVFDISRPQDQHEQDRVNKFRNETCKCSRLYDGKPCSSTLNFEELLKYRQDCMEFTNEEKELVIKGQLVAHRVKTDCTSSNKKKEKQRVKPSQRYYFAGNQICKETFKFAHDITHSTLQSIAKSLDCVGIAPRIHGNKGRTPANALSLFDSGNIKAFIEKYAVDNALPLPGRLPNCPDQTLLLLPSDKNIHDIFEIYIDSARIADYRLVSLKTFRNVWKDLCPHIALAKPMTDLCMKCQMLGHKLSQAGQLSDNDKIELADQYRNHVNCAQKQRNTYKEMTASSKVVHAEDMILG